SLPLWESLPRPQFPNPSRSNSRSTFHLHLHPFLLSFAAFILLSSVCRHFAPFPPAPVRCPVYITHPVNMRLQLLVAFPAIGLVAAEQQPLMDMLKGYLGKISNLMPATAPKVEP